MIETRPLGRGGPRVGVLGFCPAGPDRDALAESARRAGCLPEVLPPGVAEIRYSALDQLEANRAIPRAVREGRGVVAVGVLEGGALPGKAALLGGLVKPGRTLAQAAILFVLANESVTAARIRVSSRAHLEEALGALEAPPLSGSDLELIFETWAHRND